MTAHGSFPDLPDARVEATAEDLYALLPAHIRLRDAQTGGALRALFTVLARPSAEIDAELDGFYDSLFVETASAAALPLIGELVGAPVLHPVPDGAAASRALIGNIIRYRRGKGTARVVEDLAADTTGLAALAVEYFQRLSRLAHGIDPRPDRPATAFMVDGNEAARAGTGLDRMPRLPDLRRIAPQDGRGPAGRHGIKALGLHVYRPLVPTWPAPDLASAAPAALAGVPPMRPWTPGGAARAGCFQLSSFPEAPLRLFNADRSAEAAAGRPGATDLPDRLSRLPLHKETEELRHAALEGRPPRLPERPWFAVGRPFTIWLRRGAADFTRVPPAEVRIVNLETEPAGGARPGDAWPHRWAAPGANAPVIHDDSHPVACVFDPVTGRLITPAPAQPQDEVTEVRIAHGTGIGRPIGAGPQDRNDPDELFDIRDAGGLTHVIRWVDPAAPETGAPGDDRRRVQALATAFDEVRALGGGRRSLILALRTGAEPAGGNPPQLELFVPPEGEVHLIACRWVEPQAGPGAPASLPLGYIVRRERRLTLDVPLAIRRGAPAPAARAGRLVIDGIEAVRGVTLAAGSVSDLRIRHSTIRNPGAVALTTSAAFAGLAVELSASILGAVRLGTAATEVTGTLSATECLIAADGAAMPALAAPELETALCDVTVLGETALRQLDGTNVIFAGDAQVTRRQAGCLRYSYAPPGAVLPRQFRCQPGLALAAAAAAKGSALTADEQDLAARSVQPVFLDTLLDEPCGAMLHPLCPEAIRSGGEAEAEMGVFSRAAWGIARGNLGALFPDFLPYALEPGTIDDSRSGAIAARRLKP